MAEEIIIGQLDISTDALTEKLIALNRKLKEQKGELAGLNIEQENLRKEGKASSEQYKENAKQIEIVNSNIKGLSTDYRNNQKVLTQVVQTENLQLGTIQRLNLENKNLREEQKKLNLSTTEGIKRNKEINKALETNTNAVLINSDSYVQQKMNIGNYQSALEGIPGPMGNVIRSIKMMTKAGLAFIATPLGIVIGAIVAAILLLTKGFKNSQAAMDIFHRTTEAVSAAVKVLTDRVSNFVEGALAIFNKDLRESRKSARELNDELIGIDETMSRREKRQLRNANKKGLFAEIKEEFIESGKLFDALVKLEDQEIAYTKTKAELIKQINEKRLAVKDENLTDKERLAALDEAIALEKQKRDQEVAFSVERARISQEATDMGKSLRDELKSNAELQAEAAEIIAASLNAEKKLASERLSIVNKINGVQTKINEDAKKLRDAEYEKQLADERKFQELLLSEQEKAAQKKIDLYLSELQKEIDLSIENDLRRQDMEKEAAILNAENKKELQIALAATDYEAQLLQFEFQRQAEIENAERIGADVTDINARYNEINLAMERALQRGKLAIMSDFAGSIAGLFDENTAIAKTAAIAQATINTFLGATAAYSSMAGIPVVGPALGITAAAAAIAGGLKNVKEILKVKTKKGGGGGSISSSSLPTYTSSGNEKTVTTSDGGLTTRSITQGMDYGNVQQDSQVVLIMDQFEAKQSRLQESNRASIV